MPILFPAHGFTPGAVQQPRGVAAFRIGKFLLTHGFDGPPLIESVFYVNTNAGVNGDGSIGSPFSTLNNALTVLRPLTWTARGLRPTIMHSGTVAEANISLGTWNGLSGQGPLRIVGNQPTSLQYSTAHSRFENATGSGGYLFNNGCPYFILENFHGKLTASTAGGGRVGYYVDGPVRGYSIFLNCHAWAVIGPAQLSNVYGFAGWDDPGEYHQYFVINCVARDFVGTGGTHKGIAFSSGGNVMPGCFYNCTIFNCGVGIDSATGTMLVKNCGVDNCATCYSGSFGPDSTNNASDDTTADRR